MEKIYMEDNNGKKGKRGVIDASVILSFAVAIFAVFSLTMAGLSVTQNTGVSYAAPVTSDTFTLKMGKKVFAYDNPSSMTHAYIMETYYYNTVGANNAVYCIERSQGVENNDVYKNTDNVRSGAADVKNDPALLYLLGIGSNESSLTSVTQYDDDVDVWVVQSAIWYYLNEKYGDATDATNVYNLIAGTGVSSYINDKAIIEKDGNVYLSFVNDVTATAPGSFDAYAGLTGTNGKIMQLVNQAKSHTVSKVIVSKASDEISKTEDGKFYQSALITVSGNPSSSFTGYDIILSGIDGAIVVDENGDSLTLTNVAPGTKFYVRIPADKVTKEVQKLNISIKGYFNAESGTYYYVEGKADNQRMASVKPGTVLGGIDVEFVGTDDTGMSAIQTIYFIGLIVLLCGVGIVYANAKPVQVKQ